MIRHKALDHRFVDSFPDPLAPGILYVSLEYGSVAHSCCCGCGEEVVTPLTPTDWYITYDGETITLHPSVGSWTLRCRSHYVIRRSKVIEAPPWSDAEIAAERRRDRQAKARYFGRTPPDAGGATRSDQQVVAEAQAPVPEPRWWQRLAAWWQGAS
jgi:hypothetical protein